MVFSLDGMSATPPSPNLLLWFLSYSQSEGSPTLKLPKIHKRQAPEGAQVNNDLGAVMQMKELTDHDKAVLYSNYHKAMVS